MARTTDPEDHALGGARTLPLHTGREALALAASRRVASPLDGGAEPRREIRRSGLLSGNDSLDDVTTSALPVVLVVVEYNTLLRSTSTPMTSSARRAARPLQLTRL